MNKNKLDNILGLSVSSFAYPYGDRESYNHDSIKLVIDSAHS